MYVYCVVRGQVNARAVSKLPTLPDGGAPRVLPLTDNSSLIVADVRAEVYRAEEVEARLGDLDWVGRCGTAHHAVADALVTKHSVVPLRPFTLFSSEERARDVFTSRAKELEAALDRISGKGEWVLRIGKPDPARISVKPQAGGAGKTATSGAAFLAQKAAVKQSALAMAERVRRDVAAVFDAMSRIADRADRRSPEAGTGLLLDAAFLVPSRQAVLFKRALESEAKGLLRDGCRVSLTGPWPPYSFVSLDAEGRT